MASVLLGRAAPGGQAAVMKPAGAWQVEVICPGAVGSPEVVTVVTITPTAEITVTAERYERLPVFNPNAAGWSKGVPLRGVFAQECSTPGLLDPSTLRLRGGTGPEAAVFELGKDYGVEPSWGTLGRLTGGAIAEEQPVYASYRHGQLRIDSVVMSRAGRVMVRPGEPRAAAPRPPRIEEGERLLGNIWLPGRITRLGPEHLFPILETAYPEPPKKAPAPAEELLPRTMDKLRTGEPLRILAWGDSVTVGTYLANWQRDRWQEQFVARLRARFPQARIELVTEAWGGRNTDSYLGEPPGSPHNYQEKVLGAKADLVVSEFVNDAGFSPAQVEQRYSRLQADFKAAGAEWIILTPHYVRPDWMGLTQQRECDEDPRPYVKGLRQFGAGHRVALADASLRYGRLWRQGLPYNTLMLNSINHPDEWGMKIFADALLELFP
jgi:lysophospholipase L1-like esterase